MKLKTFDSTSFLTSERKQLTPFIIFNKSGRISINESARRILSLNFGDRVIFMQDEENPEHWYISKDKGTVGFKVRRESNNKSENNGVGVFCSKSLATIVLSSLKKFLQNPNKAKLKIANLPLNSMENVYAIFTRSDYISQNKSLPLGIR